MKFRVLLAPAAFAIAAVGFQPQAQAIGCISGGLAGAVAGHMVNHGVLGAIGGCVAGHAYNKRQKRAGQMQDESTYQRGSGYRQSYDGSDRQYQ
ncbi:MAG: hypothetical protein U1E70_10035 [Acetobacteraceae bacterium]